MGGDGQVSVVVWTCLLLFAASLFYVLRQPWKDGKKRLRTKLVPPALPAAPPPLLCMSRAPERAHFPLFL